MSWLQGFELCSCLNRFDFEYITYTSISWSVSYIFIFWGFSFTSSSVHGYFLGHKFLSSCVILPPSCFCVVTFNLGNLLSLVFSFTSFWDIMLAVFPPVCHFYRYLLCVYIIRVSLFSLSHHPPWLCPSWTCYSNVKDKSMYWGYKCAIFLMLVKYLHAFQWSRIKCLPNGYSRGKINSLQYYLLNCLLDLVTH